jgi:serine protease
MADAALTVLTTVPSVDFYSVNPCRVIDTRLSGGAVACGTERAITIVGGACGVPSGANAVSLNVTVTEASAAGNLRVYAAGTPAPVVSTLNYLAGVNRANNAVAPLNAAGQIAVFCAPVGATHVIVDVNGYFN